MLGCGNVVLVRAILCVEHRRILEEAQHCVDKIQVCYFRPRKHSHYWQIWEHRSQSAKCAECYEENIHFCSVLVTYSAQALLQTNFQSSHHQTETRQISTLSSLLKHKLSVKWNISRKGIRNSSPVECSSHVRHSKKISLNNYTFKTYLNLMQSSGTEGSAATSNKQGLHVVMAYSGAAGSPDELFILQFLSSLHWKGFVWIYGMHSRVCACERHPLWNLPFLPPSRALH